MPNRWSATAQIRRNQIESGKDLTFSEVFQPLIFDRLRNARPSTVLEVGAGTGHLSLALSKFGFSITAIEPSVGMYQIALEVLTGSGVDLKNCFASELKLTEPFDLAVSHMVVQVVEDLHEFFRSIFDCLRSGGRFLFSAPHPCFYNEYKKFLGADYEYMVPMTKNVSFAITKDPENLISDVPYHHRPLSQYINQLLHSGFLLESFEETYPDQSVQEKYGAPWKVPRYCLFTARKQ